MGTALDKILALTPRTPEASTVPSPIGKPGGPGLWKHKGMQLPPYIQHVAKHLIPKFGESRGIEMAVGIVKNWAEGHDGHGHHVHPDVKAAAAKNIAQWEKDKAEAHSETAAKHAAKHDKVAASMLRLADVHGYEKHLPSGRIVNVTAYRRLGSDRPYTGKLIGPEADEAIRRGEAKGEYGEPTGYFRDSEGEQHWGWHGAAGLLVRHTDEQGTHRYLIQKRAPWVQQGNTWSTPGGAMDHHNGVPETPEEAAHRESLEEFGRDLPEGTTLAGVKTRTFGEPPGDWSYHTVTMQSPHMFDPEGEGVEGVHDTRNEARGYRWVTPGEMADLPLHPAFRATAEELGMPPGGGMVAPEPGGSKLSHRSMPSVEKILLAAAAWPSGKPYASSMLPPGPTTQAGGANAAGTKPVLGYGQLQQNPSQTTAASPVLPPRTPLPTPEELSELAARVDPGDSSILLGAQKHLTDASTKMATGDYIGSLASLRSAQAGVNSEHRNRMLAAAPAMAVLYASKGGFAGDVPPAEQSSASAAARTGMSGVADMKGLAMAVGEKIDLIRRHHFHGMNAGMPSTRL